MEDGELPVVLGQGAGARTVTLTLPPFTLIGATTRAGLLTTPLRDRFGVSHRLEHYERRATSAEIVVRSAGILGVEIDDGGRARRSPRAARGTPRVANRLLQAGARLRRGQGRAARSTAERRRARRWRCSRSTRLGLDRRDRAAARRDRDQVRAAARSGSRRWRSRSARRPTRSRTSTSPTCSSRACSSARRAAVCSRSGPTSTRPARPGGRGKPLLSAIAAIATRSCASLGAGMPFFICPNCGHREVSGERTAGFQHAPQGLLEMRLRLRLRAARRLLPGAQRRLLRLRPAGAGDRRRQGELRADRPDGRGGDRPPGARGARPAVGRRGDGGEAPTPTATATPIRSRPRSSGACARSASASRSTPRAICRPRRSPTSSPPMTTTAGCCSSSPRRVGCTRHDPPVSDRRRTLFVLLFVLGLIVASARRSSPARDEARASTSRAASSSSTGAARPPSSRRSTARTSTARSTIMRERVDQFGVSEPEIARIGEDQIRSACPASTTPSARPSRSARPPSSSSTTGSRTIGSSAIGGQPGRTDADGAPTASAGQPASTTRSSSDLAGACPTLRRRARLRTERRAPDCRRQPRFYLFDKAQSRTN